MTWDVETARVRIGLEASDASRDPELQACMDAALAAAESYCDRRFLLMEDTDEFLRDAGPVLLVRRYPLESIKELQLLEPLPEPPPAPVPVPDSWRMDKKRGMVYMAGGALPAGLGIYPVGSSPPPSWPGARPGFALTYTGGYDPLPADLEAALWLIFDALWAETPGWGAAGGSQTGGGAVRSFAIDGMSISYDTSTDAGSAGAGANKGWGFIPAKAVGVLSFYRAESAAIGG